MPGIDKLAHGWAGMAIALGGAVLTGYSVIGLIIALLAGALRELLGNRDAADFYWTTAGALAGAGLFLLRAA